MLSIAAVLEHPRRDPMIWTFILVTFLQMKRKSSTVLMKTMSALLLVKGSLTCWKINKYVVGNSEVIFINMIGIKSLF